MCALKFVHLARPIVWAPAIQFRESHLARLLMSIKHCCIDWLKSNGLPERVTKSFTERFCAEKLDMRALRLKRGAGIKAFAASLLALVESLLPNLTFHEGPPSYKLSIFKQILTINKLTLIYIENEAYINNRVPGCNGKNISTRHHSRTSLLKFSFNIINDIKTSNWVIICSSCFFSYKGSVVIQQDRCIAALFIMLIQFLVH